MFNPFKKTYSMEEQTMFDFLSQIVLFKKLTSAEMALFLPYLHNREYVENEFIFLRNDPSHALYILKSGRVELSVEIDGALEKLGDLEGHHEFGHSCLIDGQKRLTNAIAKSENTQLYVIPQLNIYDIFESNPLVKAKIMEAMSETYYEYNASLINSYKSSRGFFHLSDVLGQ